MGMLQYKAAQPAVSKVDNQWAEPLAKSFPLRKLTNPKDASQNLLKTVSAVCRRQVAGLTLVFRASQHKFKSEMFHKICCDKSNTIVLALTVDNQVYGGFTPCAWKNQQYITYSSDEQSLSFLFAFGQEGQLDTFPLKSDQNSCAIMNDQQLGPVFGEGHDLLISDQSDKKQSWNNLGKSYRCEFPFGSMKANAELNGKEKFLLREYEVWEVVLN